MKMRRELKIKSEGKRKRTRETCKSVAVVIFLRGFFESIKSVIFVCKVFFLAERVSE